MLETLNIKLHSLALFATIREDALMQALSALLGCQGQSELVRVSCYSHFCALLMERGNDFSKEIQRLTLQNENVFIHSIAQNKHISDEMHAALEQELAILQELCQLESYDVKAMLKLSSSLPDWQTGGVNLRADYTQQMENVHKRGYGIFARHAMFSLRDGNIVPVLHPDPIRLDSLYGYDGPRGKVKDNTLALLAGKPAANVLLYGDAGTGKSSTVKALVNEYYDQGLRLIEVNKRGLEQIPVLLEGIYDNPLKFILFIDDLSFGKEDRQYSALKAVLEGTVSAKSPNTVIYATSNRRHFINESFSDREGDEVHREDTIQEQISLSERFGLAVNFFKPSKLRYLEIVKSLAREKEIALSEDRLEEEAEKYATLRSGRSPRVAKQFIEYLQSKE